jgi:hypothetical protein
MPGGLDYGLGDGAFVIPFLAGARDISLVHSFLIDCRAYSASNANEGKKFLSPRVKLPIMNLTSHSREEIKNG